MGSRFDKLTDKLKEKGAKHPKALAAWIGRKKYGEKAFEELEEKGKEKAQEE